MSNPDTVNHLPETSTPIEMDDEYLHEFDNNDSPNTRYLKKYIIFYSKKNDFFKSFPSISLLLNFKI